MPRISAHPQLRDESPDSSPRPADRLPPAEERAAAADLRADGGRTVAWIDARRLARRSAKRVGARLLWVLALLPFVVLATANSAGYRYGASDLAFYGPAVMRQLDPSLFPRDRPVIDAQAKLTFMDETVAAIARRTTTRSAVAVPWALCRDAGAARGRRSARLAPRLYRHRWTVAALLAACTLRHAITKSGTNTLEGYFHPRQLAFAFGVIAVAAFLRGRLVLAALALAAAGSLHPTTTLWFAVWLAVATFASAPADGRWRSRAAVGAAVAWWAFAAGPAGRTAHADGSRVARGARREGLPVPAPVAGSRLARQPRPTCRSSCWLYRRRAAAGLTRPRSGAGDRLPLAGRRVLRRAGAECRAGRARDSAAAGAHVLDARLHRHRLLVWAVAERRGRLPSVPRGRGGDAGDRWRWSAAPT